MGAHDYFEVSSIRRAKDIPVRWTAYGKIAMAEERLPFSVRAVRNEADLEAAALGRHAVQGRRAPKFAEWLRMPEAYDRGKGSVLLVAQSKFDGSPLGSLRLQSNRYGKLSIEQSVELPQWLRNRNLVEGTGLAVSDGRTARVVEAALIKAFYLYCLQSDVDWMVVAERKPMDRQYEAFLYQDVFPGGKPVPMRHIGNIPHRVMAFEVNSGEARWGEADHPLYDFMCRTWHPDIDIVGQRGNLSNDRPRRLQMH